MIPETYYNFTRVSCHIHKHQGHTLFSYFTCKVVSVDIWYLTFQDDLAVSSLG
jgi:hypothetical protein